MRSSDKSRNCASAAERGFILITLLLFVALLAIALTALAPAISQQLKRDREEELIHRGTQYSRAIKHYVKKMGAYPNRIEDLEDSNNVRFLRRRYKDPITGKDFKLLHQGDVQMQSGPGLTGATSAASLAGGAGAGGAAFGASGASPFGGSGVFGGGSNTNNGNSGGGFGNNSAFGGNSGGFGSNSAFGGNSGGFGGSPGQTQSNNSDTSNQAEGTPNSQNGQNGQGGFGQSVQSLGGFNSQGNNNQVFGGGPVVGVVSLSKEKSIRSFAKKDHYNDWQFVYDMTSDRGALITTPYQSPMQTAAQTFNSTPGVSNGTPGANGAPPTPPGSSGGQQNSPGSFWSTTPQMPPEQGPQ